MVFDGVFDPLDDAPVEFEFAFVVGTPSGEPDPWAAPPGDDGVVVVDVGAFPDVVTGALAASAFAAFAACATNIPVASPELKKMA